VTLSHPTSAEILRRTSRTFALSIQALPRRLREPVEVAYLLARAADTIADAPGPRLAARLARLEAFRAAVCAGTAAAPATAARGRGADDPVARAEAALLAGIGELLGRLDRLAEADRQDVALVVGRLAATMEGELRWFGEPEPGAPVALPDARALGGYTEGIAGCVGAFWTSLADRHCGPFRPARRRVLAIEGRRYGRGLQLVNVLRDLPRDLRRGRCFLPADELRAAGLEAGDLLDPAVLPRLRPVLAVWEARARRGLLSGLVYAARLPRRRWGLRVATALPAALGLPTLSAVARSDDRLDPSRPVKLTRRRVRTVAAAAGFWALLPAGPLRLARVSDPPTR
jgi:farnesyl-diphosphate farnesyltransferase